MARRPDTTTKTIGAVRIRYRADRGRWTVRWVDSVGKSRARWAPTEQEADTIAAQVAVAMATPGSALQPDVTWGALRTAYLDPAGHAEWRSPNTGTKAASISRVHLSAIDGRKCSTLGPADFNGQLQAMAAAGYAASTIRTAWEVLRAIVRWGQKRGVWDAWTDPLAGVGIPRQVKKQRIDAPIDRLSEVPTAAQVDDLADAIALIDPSWGLLVRFAAGTGMRLGELFGLRVGDIDLAKREVKVLRQVREVAGSFETDALPKHEKTRTTVFPESLLEDLTAHLADKGPDDYVWQARGGKPKRRSSFGKVFRDARSGSTYPDHLTMHSLRHFWVCSMLDDGVRLATVSKLAGHSTVRFTMDRYVGADDEYLDEARSKTASR